MLTVNNAPSHATDFIASIPTYASQSAGRGIVTCAGGVKYLTCAWVQIAMLRRLGCKLPIQVWYLGEDEGDPEWMELAKSFDVECINAFDVRLRHPHRHLGGWEAKAYAILHCRFQEVLFLDADNVPAVDPTFLFSLPEYQETGALFWPDTTPLSRERQAWQVFDVKARDECAFESGQMLIHKERCWRALNLCDWYNQHSDFFYRFVYGDKETFHFAWHRLKQAFTMAPFPPRPAPFGLIQFDLAGRRLFQHRIRAKWSLSENRRFPEFEHEEACLESLRQLAERWDPITHLIRHFRGQDWLQMQSLAEKYYRLICVGGRSWPVQLQVDGRVAGPAGLLEQFWWCDGGRVVLAGHDGRVTTELSERSGATWHGRCRVRGNKEIRLVRTRRWSGPPLAAAGLARPARSGEALARWEEGGISGRRHPVCFPRDPKNIQLIDLPKKCFNPSIVRYQGRLLMAYRESLSASENTIRVVYLTNDFRPEGLSRRLEIAPARSLPSCWEDPRLFHFRERLFCSFTYWVPSLGNNRTAVGVCELGVDLQVLGVRYPRHGFNHNACTGGDQDGQEKNWVFFEHDGLLNFIYDTVPFEVAEYDFDEDRIGMVTRTFPKTEWFWGKIRGGTPPVLAGDRYVSFFHSSLRHQGHVVYYAGAMTFLPERPFRIHEMSAKPLLAGPTEAGRAKSVIFPGSADCNDDWSIACGVNDARCAIYTFKQDDVASQLQRIHENVDQPVEAAESARQATECELALHRAKKIVVLFTPIHTGTHFVRMLLESHPKIGAAIGEDFRIDSAFRPDYVLAGRGMGNIDPSHQPGRDQSSERMLREYFCDYLKGCIQKKAFEDALTYWRLLTSEAFAPRRNYEHHLVRSRNEFNEFGIELPAKQERLLLYRGHCHAEHRGYDLSTLTRAFHVVVTIRHPLMSILSIMHRNPVDQHETLIANYIAAMQCIFSLKDAFVFCTDLWQEQPDRMATMFEFLKLPMDPATERFLELRPRVNSTVAKGERHNIHNYCVEFEHPPEFRATLCEAKELLRARKCHPLLAPYRERIKQAGLVPHYERWGYDMM